MNAARERIRPRRPLDPRALAVTLVPPLPHETSMHLVPTNERESRVLRHAWIATLVLAGVCAWAWGRTVEPEQWKYGALATLGFLSVPGKFVIFWGCSDTSPLGPWGLVVLGLVADLVLALTLAALLGPLGRLPKIGPWLKRCHDQAAHVLEEYPRLSRMAFVGVSVFVFLPLPGTGVIGGTFAGQLLGLSRVRTILAILAGSTTTMVLFAALADALGAEAQTILANPWIAVASAAVFAVLVVVAYRRVRRLLRHP